MTGISSYSTTASENINANTGINWDEGMAPAAVNNSARQNMADIRSRWNDASWFQYGIGSKTVAAVYASSTSFTLAGGDATVYWHAGRRVKAVGSTTGTIYGTVTSSAFATSTTTVNVLWDSGSLSNEALTIYGGTIPVIGASVPFAGVASTRTNDSAAAGIIGEYISNSYPDGTINLTTATAADIGSIDLTPGDWDVEGNVSFVPATTTTIDLLTAWTGGNSATLPTRPNGGAYTQSPGFGFAPNNAIVLPIARQRVSLAVGISIFLSARALFGTSTMTAGGFIGARRVR